MRISTPVLKRTVITRADEREFEETRVLHKLSRPTEHSVVPAASWRMARAPHPLLREEGPTGPEPGPRYLTSAGWAKAPPRLIPGPRRRTRSPKPWSDATGDAYWIVDQDTGTRQHRILAQTPARAATLAGLWALAQGLKAKDAYAQRDL